MANKWDDFHENMGDEQAALHMSGAFDSEVGHDHDSTLPGRGAPIKSTVDQTLAGGANTGTNNQILSWIVRQIKAITGNTNWYDTITKSWKDAFETDGTTVKKATNATLAEAAKGTTRFQISGGNRTAYSIAGGGSKQMQTFSIKIGHEKKLVLKNVRFSLSNANLRLRINTGGGGIAWVSSGNQGDVNPEHTIVTNTGGSDILYSLIIYISNASTSTIAPTEPYIYEGWWLDLAIEDV